jgi:L-alanine-DL-glutamate epimerase-like enolase superfamily enzyme
MKLPASRGGALTIAAVKAAQLRNMGGQCLVKVETDAGLVGLGEAGAGAAAVRAHLADITPWLVGQDALELDRLFARAAGLMHPSRAHIPTVSGLDIALWDLAGKALGRPVSSLLTGRLRESVPVYATGNPQGDHRDPAVWRDWAAGQAARFPGWKTMKLGFDPLVGVGTSDLRRVALPALMLGPAELSLVGLCFERAREALGGERDIIVHCHNEWDLPTSLGIAEAVAPARPLWLEDPMPLTYSASWRELARRSAVRIATGEKLELAREFVPFIVNGAVHAVHPDLVYAGGITGCRRIADLAELYQVPVVTHCVGSVVQMAATVHFGACTRNFVMTETRLGHADHGVQQVGADQLPISGGLLAVPRGPGLGITLTDDMLRYMLEPGEQWC